MVGWLTTVVARVSLEILRSRKSLRKEPLGVRLAEPIMTSVGGIDPEHEDALADSVGLALLVSGTRMRVPISAPRAWASQSAERWHHER